MAGRPLSKHSIARTSQGGEVRSPEPGTMLTLLVPYTMGSRLRDKMQQVEDQYVALMGGSRVRMVEKG